MLSGSRFTDLLPLSPLPRPITRRGRNMSSFLANLTRALMQPPCSFHDFDAPTIDTRPVVCPFPLLGQIISERELLNSKVYTHPVERRWTSRTIEYNPIRKITMGFSISISFSLMLLTRIWISTLRKRKRRFDRKNLLILPIFLFFFFYPPTIIPTNIIWFVETTQI